MDAFIALVSRKLQVIKGFLYYVIIKHIHMVLLMFVDYFGRGGKKIQTKNTDVDFFLLPARKSDFFCFFGPKFWHTPGYCQPFHIGKLRPVHVGRNQNMARYKSVEAP